MTAPAPTKSTIVRSTLLVTRLADAVAPDLLARWVTRRFFRLPPAMPVLAAPAGGTPFEVAWESGTVRGRVFGDGPVVYLVHGWGGRSDQFAAMVPPLVAAGHRVVLFDGPSHGSSEPGAFGPGSTTGVEFGKALDAVFCRFGPAHAVIAHSMGAVATMLALTHGWMSAERLVLVAPMSGYAATMDGLQSMLGFGPRTRRRVDRRVFERVGLPRGGFDIVGLWGRLDRPLPALVVHDRSDRQTPYGESAALARSIDAELVTTNGLGHNRILGAPEVVDRVVGFLADRERLERTA